MSEQPPPERPTTSPDLAPARRSAGWTAVLAPAVALLVGLLIGGLVVGAGRDDDTSTDPSEPGTASGGSSPSPGAYESAGVTTVVVPDACLDAVDTVEEATQLTRKGAGAIRDFDPEELRSLLSQLETLDQQARRQARTCREADVE